jgi:dolichol-phosphate mannosyltransferase
VTGREPKVVVVVPTYNERENLPALIAQLLPVGGAPNLSVLVVDDDSPDGTGDCADALAAELGDRVTVLHRRTKDGLGRAYVDGMTAALAQGADIVVQMDADLSHPVAVIPRMLEVLRTSDAAVVIGSRYVRGGAVSDDWPLRRRLLSRWANLYVNGVLRLGVKDTTSGFKAWRTSTLAAIDVRSIESNGYSFQVEMNHRTVRCGLTIAEVPIRFEERARGASKMTLRVQLESVVMPWTLLLRVGRPARRAATPEVGQGAERVDAGFSRR